MTRQRVARALEADAARRVHDQSQLWGTPLTALEAAVLSLSVTGCDYMNLIGGYYPSVGRLDREVFDAAIARLRELGLIEVTDDGATLRATDRAAELLPDVTD